MIAGTLSLPAFTEFVYVFVEKKISLLLRYANVIGSVLIITTIYSNVYAYDGGPYLGFPYWPIVGITALLEMIFYCMNILFSEIELFGALKISSGNKQQQIKYLIFATILGYFGAGTNFLLWFRIPFPPVFNILIAFYIGIIAYAILIHHLMDISVVIRKGLLYSLIVALLSGFYLSVVFLFGNYLGGRKSAASIMFTIFSIVFFSLIFQPLRDRIQEFIDRVFFRSKYDYQKTLRELSQTARSVEKVDDLLDMVVPSLVNMLKLSCACVYTADKHSGQFIPRKTVQLSFNPPMLQKDDSLIKALSVKREPVFAGDVAANESRIGSYIKAGEASIFLPILFKDQLVGFLCLGKKLSEEPFNSEDVDLLSTLCNQIGVSIQYAALYEDSMDAQKQLYQADKLATLGTLAAGLAHEIKNPITAIKGFTQIIKDSFRKGDEEAINDFEKVVPNQLDRINGIVEKLLKLSKPSTMEKKALNVNIILDDLVKLTERQAAAANVFIIKDLKAANAIYGTADQLTQAFLNLILNGIQAMPKGGTLMVKSRDMNERGHKVIVKIRDTGVGIPKEEMSKIFDPFFTTKESGAGLGLAVTKKIIEEHNGTIEVESEPGRGTTFRVNL